jgi:hypothetical protein
MNKTILSTSVAAILGTVLTGGSTTASANLGTSAILSFQAGVYTCVMGNCVNYGTNVATGSYFALDANGNGSFQSQEKTALVMHDGIHMGATQSASGSHTGDSFGTGNGYTGTNYVMVGMDNGGTPTNPNDDLPLWMQNSGPNSTATTDRFVANTTEAPGIDEPWSFFGNTGMHYTSSPITVANDLGFNAGTGKYEKELDFTGWGVTWNGIPAIPMGGDAANFPTNNTGLALIECSLESCSQSSTFTLTYRATIPQGSSTGFGGVSYKLVLKGGHVGGGNPLPAPVPVPVPVPAAVWLFGSGLIGLIGLAKRKKV